MPRRAREQTARHGASGERECLWGNHCVGEALRAERRELRRLRVETGSRRPDVEAILAAARSAGVPIEEVSAEQLSAGLEPGSAPQGVVLEAGPLPELSLAAPDPPNGAFKAIERKLGAAWQEATRCVNSTHSSAP